MASIPAEDVMRIVVMTTKYLKYYISLVDKAAAGLEKIDSNFERITVGKLLSHNIACYKKSFMKGRVNQ